MKYERLRLLVVDDNSHMRLLLGDVLRAIGVRTIFEASNGPEAMKMLREHQVDIVLTDLAMPGEGGLEFIRHMRATEGDNQLAPIIVVSGRSTAQAVLEARDAGANDFLTKPISVRAVLERLHEVIEHPKPFLRTEAYFGPDRRRRNDPKYPGPYRREDDPQPSAAGDSTPGREA
jgi:two-component system chemotaxis response regulator CheY